MLIAHYVRCEDSTVQYCTYGVVLCEGLRTASLGERVAPRERGSFETGAREFRGLPDVWKFKHTKDFRIGEDNDIGASKTWPFILLQVHYFISSNSKVRHRKQY